jgi:hypothetical protein
MPFDKAAISAVEHLTSDATLDELRNAAQDLRALSPDSVLAELVEEKIERILSEEQDISVKMAKGPMPQQETGSR